MKVLSTSETAPNPARPATQVLHDEPGVRIVSFHLLPDQAVKPHRNQGTVAVLVVEGEGYFAGAEGERLLAVGEGAVFEPGEVHVIRTAAMPLRFVATIISPPA